MTDCAEKMTMETMAILLKPYQQLIESKIKEDLSEFGSSGGLREACEYALLNGGRRVRPTLVYLIAEAIGKNIDVSMAALGVEYTHTASLIADDLPCMDNDAERRNKPSTHVVYGESVALLASYALISAANRCIPACVAAIESTLGPISPVSCSMLGLMALDNAAENTGVQGTTGGQFLDIFPPDLSLETMREVIRKKTVSLFELSFVFGWLFGGGNPELLHLIKKCAAHFGMAFQIADDLDDLEQDAKNERKINMAAVFGVEKAHQMFHEEITQYYASLKALNLSSIELVGLGQCFEEMVKSLRQN